MLSSQSNWSRFISMLFLKQQCLIMPTWTTVISPQLFQLYISDETIPFNFNYIYWNEPWSIWLVKRWKLTLWSVPVVPQIATDLHAAIYIHVLFMDWNSWIVVEFTIASAHCTGFCFVFIKPVYINRNDIATIFFHCQFLCSICYFLHFLHCNQHISLYNIVGSTVYFFFFPVLKSCTPKVHNKTELNVSLN